MGGPANGNGNGDGAARGRGFGVAAGLDPEVAARLAGRCAELGYRSVWSNDHPAASGIETLAAFAEGSDAVELGVAALALDRHAPAEINERITACGLDRDRLWIGVGAGFDKRPLTRMRDAVDELREAIPGVRLALAAMGPRMCALAGAAYDGAFLNWMTPGHAAAARGRVASGAIEAGRQPPPVLAYVRTAVGPDAETRLAKEEGFYRDLHAGYHQHFERLGEPEGTVGVAVERAADASPKLAAYAALDLIVVRALASARLEAMDKVATAAAPQAT